MHGRHPNAQLDPGLDTEPARVATATLRERREVRPAKNGPLVLVVGLAAVVAVIAILVGGSNRGDGEALQITDPITTDAPSAADAAATAASATQTQAATAASGEQTLTAATAEAGISAEVAERPSVDLDGCMLNVIEIKLGDSGDSVECTQKALYAAGFYDGDFTGVFDDATDQAVRAAQGARDLYVDGVVGAQTATSLGIWPGDESFVVKTPKPAPGAVDLWGMALSPVASAGSDAPPLPDGAGQGTGYRIVYSRAMQRVWAINDAEQVVRSYLVTGSQYHNEVPGVHEVYSRSETTTAWNGQATLLWMVRWLDTERGAIGFHQIPVHNDTGEVYETVDQLGTKLSGGCQRQTELDAKFMWAFGQIGTKVWVL